MMETAEVLGEQAFRAARDTCVNMALPYWKGFREDGALLTEYDPVTGVCDTELVGTKRSGCWILKCVGAYRRRTFS